MYSRCSATSRPKAGVTGSTLLTGASSSITPPASATPGRPRRLAANSAAPSTASPRAAGPAAASARSNSSRTGRPSTRPYVPRVRRTRAAGPPAVASSGAAPVPAVAAARSSAYSASTAHSGHERSASPLRPRQTAKTRTHSTPAAACSCESRANAKANAAGAHRPARTAANAAHNASAAAITARFLTHATASTLAQCRPNSAAASHAAPGPKPSLRSSAHISSTVATCSAPLVRWKPHGLMPHRRKSTADSIGRMGRYATPDVAASRRQKPGFR